ncbi:MAG TPA: hypothetical protein PKU80_10265 [Candidatus Limiplasma sp.]|nr:hypothetical protein [Candidatus Limiplasma sp.]HRX07569.1 hypothetical protein [Candidatus Limiplasma sp.]
MKLKLWQIGLIIFVVIFGGIGVAMLTGDWATQSDKVPAKFTTGDFAGEYNPEDIRGSYTFQDVADTFQIDLAVLFDAFGIPADTDGTAIKSKDIEAQYGEAEIGNASMQLFVGLYKGLPVALIDSWLTPRAAQIILEANPNLTQEQLDYIATHQVDLALAETEPAEDAPAVEEAAPETQEHSTEDQPSVKGTTTFQQVLDLGLSREQVEEIIGGTMPAANMLIRDYCTEKGLSFSTIKTALSDALASLN